LNYIYRDHRRPNPAAGVTVRKVTIGGDDGTDRVGELMLQLDWRDDSGGEMKTIVAG